MVLVMSFIQLLTIETHYYTFITIGSFIPIIGMIQAIGMNQVVISISNLMTEVAVGMVVYIQ